MRLGRAGAALLLLAGLTFAWSKLRQDRALAGGVFEGLVALGAVLLLASLVRVAWGARPARAAS